MNASGLAHSYSALTAEERFRLIAAAGARGDDVEQERLVRAARRFTVSMPDHSPYGHAFNELSILVFIELVEEAARYREAFDRADEIRELFEEDEENEASGVDEAQDGVAVLQEAFDQIGLVHDLSILSQSGRS